MSRTRKTVAKAAPEPEIKKEETPAPVKATEVKIVDRKARSIIWGKLEKGWEPVQHIFAVNEANWLKFWQDREPEREFLAGATEPV